MVQHSKNLKLVMVLAKICVTCKTSLIFNGSGFKIKMFTQKIFLKMWYFTLPTNSLETGFGLFIKNPGIQSNIDLHVTGIVPIYHVTHRLKNGLHIRVASTSWITVCGLLSLKTKACYKSHKILEALKHPSISE